ncbi:hypothetical protein HYZ41_04885 [archaeon]|nr:hypothetical protein [archaeon]
MQQKTKSHIELYLLVFVVIISLAVFFVAPRTTGFVSAKNTVTDEQTDSTGTSDSIDVNKKYGIIQGNVQFIINDGDVVVASDSGADFTLYFSEVEIKDYSLVKTSDKKYDGTIDNIDPDGTGYVCSSSTFTTQKMYYDKNNDDKQSKNENDVYTITTDLDGCYAVKVPEGSWNLYW